MTDAKIRRGTRDDADFLAWVMLEASRSHVDRGIWDLIVGGDDTACLDYLRRLSVAEPKSLCHFERFRVAEVDGRPAAALCVFDPREGGWPLVARAMACVQRDLGWSEADVVASRERMEPARACFIPDGDEDWCIEFVATRPEYRRRGLVDTLMRAAIEEGAARGFKLAQITLLVGNDRAQSAYEKCGFRLHEERGSDAFRAAMGGASGFRSLLRRL
jgi:ribosomal protein S18 acetylase RimI-like enzyme